MEKARRAAKEQMDKDYQVPCAIALQASFAVYIVIAMFGSDWDRTSLWILFGMSSALWYQAQQTKEDNKNVT